MAKTKKQVSGKRLETRIAFFGKAGDKAHQLHDEAVKANDVQDVGNDVLTLLNLYETSFVPGLEKNSAERVRARDKFEQDIYQDPKYTEYPELKELQKYLSDPLSKQVDPNKLWEELLKYTDDLDVKRNKKFNGKVPTEEEITALFDKKYPVAQSIPSPKLDLDQYALLRIVESDPSAEGAEETQDADISTLVASFKLNPITENFLRSIVQDKMQPLLIKTLENAYALFEALFGRFSGSIVTAGVLDESTKRKIENQLAYDTYGKGSTMVLKNIVDPSILDGYKLIILGREQDYSYAPDVDDQIKEFTKSVETYQSEQFETIYKKYPWFRNAPEFPTLLSDIVDKQINSMKKDDAEFIEMIKASGAENNLGIPTLRQEREQDRIRFEQEKQREELERKQKLEEEEAKKHEEHH